MRNCVFKYVQLLTLHFPFLAATFQVTRGDRDSLHQSVSDPSRHVLHLRSGQRSGESQDLRCKRCSDALDRLGTFVRWWDTGSCILLHRNDVFTPFPSNNLNMYFKKWRKCMTGIRVWFLRPKSLLVN